MTDKHGTGSAEPMRVPMRFFSPAVLWCVMKGAAVGVVTSFALSFFAHLNARILPSFPWFLAPVAITCLIVLGYSEFKRSSVPVLLRGSRALWISLGLALALGLTAIMLSGIANLLAGALRLPGDKVPGTMLFQGLATFAIVSGAAFVEESVVRGQVQSRLQAYVPRVAAEAIADVLFVLLHFARFAQPGEVVFVSLTALACGRMATLTQSLRWPVAIHLGSNLIIMGTILASRI